MKPFKNLFGKSVPAAGNTPSPDATGAAADASIGQEAGQKGSPRLSWMKMPAELMQELFPEREVMVSVIFGEANAAGAGLPAAAANSPELPKSKPQPQGAVQTPEVLSISDELREAIFPTQKVMVSVIFNESIPTPLTPRRGRRHRSDEDASAEDDSDRRHDFPII